MTEFTTPPNDAITYCNYSNAEILSSHGRSNDYCISIKYKKQINRNRIQITYWPVTYIELYRSYMKVVPMFNQKPEKWDEVIFDVYKVDVDQNFARNMEKVFKKHNWVKTAFPRDPHKMPITDFSRVWKSGTDIIIGILTTARLIGNSDELEYNDRKDHIDHSMPVSIRIGKHATKDCLYNINKGIYPDFYEIKPYADLYRIKSSVDEPKMTHYNISEILKDYKIPDAYNIWASKLDRFYSTNTYRSLDVTDSYIRSILLRSARKTIYESLLSNTHKEEEITKLNEYGMY